uniref:Uncharacterized protein n=1 Tax=Meloidogyne hapla TaxID=6305 RepID=A0A1I8B1Z5_MELHA
MQKSYGYILYAAYKMVKEKQNDNNEESVTMLKDSLEEDTVNLLENQKEERKINTKDKREKRGSENIRRSPTGVYTMSFISKNCQKEYGVKWIEQ